MIINRIYIFVIRKKFSCKKRGTQPHKSAQENPFKKFIELKSNKSNRLEHNLNFHSHLQYLKQRLKETDLLNQRERKTINQPQLIEIYTKFKSLVNKDQKHSRTRKFQKARDQRKSKKKFFITNKNQINKNLKFNSNK